MDRYISVLQDLEEVANKKLAKVSYASAKAPVTTILASLFCCFACMAGFATFKQENDGQKLWVDQNSDAKKYNELADEFGGFPQNNLFIIAAKKEGENVMTFNALYELFELLEEIQALESSDGLRYADICSRNAAGQCSYGGVLAIWGGNRTRFLTEASTDEDIKLALSAETFPDTRKLTRDQLYAKYEPEEDDATLTSMQAFKCSLPTEGVSIEELRNWEMTVIEYLWDVKATRRLRDTSHITYFINFDRSLDDEMARNISNDIMMFAVGFLLMSFTCSVMLGQPGHSIKGRFLLGGMEFYMVLIATGAGYGIGLLFGKDFNTLHQLLPFILVGIGIDGAFVICNAFDDTDKLKPIEERMQDAMERCGMSLTATSLTDIIAFACGSVSKFPAVSSFCVYASIAVLFIWGLHFTCFVALLVLDYRRQAAGRADVLCCMKPTKPCLIFFDMPCSAKIANESGEQLPQEQRTRRLFRAFGQTITGSMAVKGAILFFFLAIAVASSVAVAIGFDMGLQLTDLTPDNSYAREYFNAQEAYWEVSVAGSSPFVSLIIRDIDISTLENQVALGKMGKDWLSNEYMDASIDLISWHSWFTRWAVCHRNQSLGLGAAWPAAMAPVMAAYLPSFPPDMPGINGTLMQEFKDMLPEGDFAEVACTGGEEYGVECGQFYTGSNFADAVKKFLEFDTFSRFAGDLKFKGHKIDMFRVSGHHISMPKTSIQLQALNEAEEWYEGLLGPLKSKVVTSSQIYPIYDQYRIIVPETLTTFGMAIMAIIVIATFVLIHPLQVVIIALILVDIFLVLTASINMWGLELNSVSSICLIMAMGLVVDYSVHIMHNFAIQDSTRSRNERVVNCLAEIGPAVGQGALSTFIAIMPLALSRSNTFRVFFKMFFGIVIVGFSHGLVLAPVLLSLIGPSLPQKGQGAVEVRRAAAE